jgi:glycosyltransferase involved in cell wall biosynthesis
MPEVSIGMPVYNDVSFIEKSINSILNQSFEDFQLILSDDNSTDGSYEICKKIAQKDKRIKLIRHEKNIGISRNMKYLLGISEGKYFMWAGNDDLWHKDFIKILRDSLEESNENYICAFGGVLFIDESDKEIRTISRRINDFGHEDPIKRILKVITFNDDSFGYALFKREEIVDVDFPIWWWKNKICAYNNIYPSLIYYMAKGNFKLSTKDIIWYNRLKTPKKINHTIPYDNSFVRGIFFFMLRKFNLVFESSKLICKTNLKLSSFFKILPYLIFYWFLIPVYSEFGLRLKNFLNGDLRFY